MKKSSLQLSELARVPMFHELAPADLSAIADSVTTVTAGSGDVVVAAGQSHGCFYWVQQGQVQLVLSTADAQQKVMSVVSAGQTFGEALLFTGRPHPASAVALTPAVLAAIPHAPVLRLAERSPRFALRVAAGLANQLHQLVVDVESYVLHTGTQRALSYLWDLAPTDQIPVRVVLPVHKGVIASRLSLQPETFSRILRRLSDEGVLRVDGRCITLLRRASGPGEELL